jgi:hypothetical protein
MVLYVKFCDGLCNNRVLNCLNLCKGGSGINLIKYWSWLTNSRRIILIEKLIVAQLVKNCSFFREPESSLS